MSSNLGRPAASLSFNENPQSQPQNTEVDEDSVLCASIPVRDERTSSDDGPDLEAGGNGSNSSSGGDFSYIDSYGSVESVFSKNVILHDTAGIGGSLTDSSAGQPSTFRRERSHLSVDQGNRRLWIPGESIMNPSSEEQSTFRQERGALSDDRDSLWLTSVNLSGARDSFFADSFSSSDCGELDISSNRPVNAGDIRSQQHGQPLVPGRLKDLGRGEAFVLTHERGRGMPSNARPTRTPVGRGGMPPSPPRADVAPMNASATMSQCGGQATMPVAPARNAPNNDETPPLFTRPQKDTIPIELSSSILKEVGTVPYAADSRFVQIDTGNAVPKLMRSTVYSVPRDPDIASKTMGDNFAMICTPLGLPSQDYMARPRVLPDGSEEDWQDAVQSIPVIISNEPLPRCPHCAAYVNPFWQRSGICNFCNTRTNYNVDQLDRRMFDCGTVEYQVGGPYWTRPTPVPPVFLYALDATCPRLTSYVEMLKELGESMATHCQRQSQPVKMRIGVCLVASFGVVIVNFDSSQNLKLTVMPDVEEDPFSPLPLDKWTYDVSTNDGLNQWQSLTSRLLDEWRPCLQQLSHHSGYGPYHGPHRNHSCGGAALAVLADALQETGGRATWLTWRRPNFGVGAIENREQDSSDQKYTRESTERELYTPLQLQEKSTTAGDFYKELGEKCAKSGICIDVIYHTPPNPGAVFLDTATTGELCRISCGRLIWLRATQSKDELLEELRRPALSFFGTDAALTIRCPAGIKVKSSLQCTSPGVTVNDTNGDFRRIDLAHADSQSSFAFGFEYQDGGLPQDSPLAPFQMVLSFKTPWGERRVRVSTMAVRVTEDKEQVFNSFDLATLASVLTRDAVHKIRHPSECKNLPLLSAREDLMTDFVRLLSNYRRYACEKSAVRPNKFLHLPRLHLLPIFIMSLLKSPLLRKSLPKAGSGIRSVKPSPSADERAYNLFYGSSVLPQTSMLQVHANVLCISSLGEGDGEWQVPQISMAWSDLDRAAHPAYIQIPPTIRPSITCLEDHGIYLIDDGFTIFLYLGKDVTKEVSGELLEWSQDGGAVLKTTEYGNRVRRLVWQMKTYSNIGGGCESRSRATIPPIEVVVGDESHKNPLVERVMALMVHDPTDYAEFKKCLHNRVLDA